MNEWVESRETAHTECFQIACPLQGWGRITNTPWAVPGDVLAKTVGRKEGRNPTDTPAPGDQGQHQQCSCCGGREQHSASLLVLQKPQNPSPFASGNTSDRTSGGTLFKTPLQCSPNSECHPNQGKSEQLSQPRGLRRHGVGLDGALGHRRDIQRSQGSRNKAETAGKEKH